MKMISALAAGLAAALALAPPASALDMTGTWTFKGNEMKCKGFGRDGEKTTLVVPADQVDPLLVDAASPFYISASFLSEAGAMVVGSEDKGAALFADCDGPFELYLHAVRTFPVNGKGVTGVAAGDLRGLIGPSVAVCKVKFERVSTASPGLGEPACVVIDN